MLLQETKSIDCFQLVNNLIYNLLTQNLVKIFLLKKIKFYAFIPLPCEVFGKQQFSWSKGILYLALIITTNHSSYKSFLY